MERQLVNVFDFDKTIYKYDSEEQFIKFLINKKPFLYFYIPYFVYGYLKFRLRLCNEQEMKEYYYRILKYFNNTNILLEEFWDKEEKNIFPYFKEIHKEDDIVISASNYLLLNPICKRLNIRYLITGDFDLKTLKFVIPDCKGEEKVRRLKLEREDVIINNFYSDSYSDTPLAEIAKHAYMVSNKGTLSDWKF